MKLQNLVLTILLLSLMACNGQSQNWNSRVRGEGPLVERELDVRDFTGVKLAISGNVFLQQGPDYEVRVKAQENIIDALIMDKKGDDLVIRFEGSVSTRRSIDIFITLPKLSMAYVSGSGDMVGKGTFTGTDNFSVGISGSGDMELRVETGDLEGKISGSGDMKLGGKANNVELQVTGSGDLDADELVAQNVQVRISGSGDVAVHAEENLEVRTSGSGDVAYRGRPRVRSNISGSGDVYSKD